MSLERQIEDLNSSILELALVLRALVPPTVTQAIPPVEVKIEPTQETPQPAPEVKPAKAAKAAKPKAEEAAPAITREQVATQVIAVVKAKGRDAAIGALQSLGYAKVPDCPDEKLADLFAALVKAAE